MKNKKDLENERIEELEANSIEKESNVGLEGITGEIIEDVDLKNWKNLEWWMNIPSKDRFKVGDIIFINNLKKFGIFIEPARKEGLIKLRLFKKRTKVDVYSRDWYLDFYSIDLVKRGSKVKRGYIETEEEFIKRLD